jgi:hypothetical protein
MKRRRAIFTAIKYHSLAFSIERLGRANYSFSQGIDCP